MQDLWEKAGLESIDTQVIRIPIVYRDFDDFWELNTVLIGPQGKIISWHVNEREERNSAPICATVCLPLRTDASSTNYSQTP